MLQNITYHLKNLICQTIALNVNITIQYFFDAIRNNACDLKSSDIIYDRDGVYKDFDEA